MLNSTQHGISNAHKFKYQEIQLFSGSDKPRMLFFLLINVKMPTTVGILTIMSRKNFMLNSVEHEKSFITSGPGLGLLQRLSVSISCLVNGQFHSHLEIKTF